MMRGTGSIVGIGNEEESEEMKMSAWRRRGRKRSSRGGGGGGGGGGEGGPCGACKFLRRKCMRGCVFAPYFGADEEGREGFSAVHKVFGASNVSKLLQRIPHPDQRRHALITLQYQAHARLLDPIYGCLRTIFALKRQVENLQAELEYVRAELMYSQQEVLTRDGLLLQHEVEMNGYVLTSNNAQYQEELCCIKADESCNFLDMHMSLNYNSSDGTLHDDQFFEHPPFSNALSLQESHVQRLNLLEFLVTQDFAHELPY